MPCYAKKRGFPKRCPRTRQGSDLSALLDAIQIIDDGQYARVHDRFRRGRQRKYEIILKFLVVESRLDEAIAPNRHVSRSMRGHPLTAIDDSIDSFDREHAPILLGQNSEVARLLYQL